MKDKIEKKQKSESGLEQVKPGKRSLERMLIESERRLVTLINNLPGVVYRCKNDRDWTMEYISQGCEELFGYKDKDLLNNTTISFNDLISPEDRQAVWNSIQSALTEKKSYQIVYRIQTAQGHIKWVWEKGSGVFGESGEVIALEGFITDITERKKAEEALQESEAKYRILVENVLIGVYIIQDNIFRFVNKRFCEIYGYSYEEVVDNLTPMDLTYHRDRKIVAENVRKRLNGEVDSVHYTVKGLRKDGQIIATEIFGRSTVYKGRRAILGTIIDTTEKNHAEEALAKSYALLKGVIESPKNVVIFALDHQYRYIAFNRNHHQTMKRIWGVDIALGKSMLEYIKNTEDRQKARENFDRALSGESFMVIEEYGDTMLERRSYEDIYNPIFDETGNIIGLTLFLTDITHRRQAEEEKDKLHAQLSQAQKMESVGRLAGGVAHDFNNMLSVIIGYSELVMNQLDAKDPLFASIQQIRKAAGRSADLTRQLLAFARKQTVSPKVLNLNECVESMLKMLRRLIGEDIDLAWVPSAKIWPVSVDPTQIDQILANLCVNARDAISGVGRITIETHAQNIDEFYCAGHPDAAPGEYVVLSVTDKGSGMDKETLANLFEPFFTTKETGKGTGLGLATVYGIVKQNSGFINVYSEPGHGTIFKIYLPRHIAEITQAQEETPALPTSPGNETILLVEDEAAILDIGKLMLESLGYLVLTASTPTEAIHTAGEHAGGIQLLITDVIMPEMNGGELAKNLVSLCPGIRILFISGYTGDVIVHHGVLDEGRYFVQKPFSIEGLASKVREALDGK